MLRSSLSSQIEDLMEDIIGLGTTLKLELRDVKQQHDNATLDYTWEYKGRLEAVLTMLVTIKELVHHK